MFRPGKTIGIIGGGQLGQMLTFSAKKAGFRVIILDPNPDCSAGQAADDQIVAEYADRQAIEKLAKKADVLTYEFENVDLKALEAVQTEVSIPHVLSYCQLLKIACEKRPFCAIMDYKWHHLQLLKVKQI